MLSEVPIGRTVRQRQGLRVPDLLVAFGVVHAGVIEQHGYSIEERGKPPDFVLEIASVNTGRVDYTQKRADYATFDVPEYWRVDPSGGAYHNTSLAGDRLVDGVYQPIEVVQVDESRYLQTYDEEAEGSLAEAEGRRVEAERHLAAEERVRELEAQVRRLEGDSLRRLFTLDSGKQAGVAMEASTQEGEMKVFTETRQVTLRLTRSGHWRLDDLLEQNRTLYNAALQERFTA